MKTILNILIVIYYASFNLVYGQKATITFEKNEQFTKGENMGWDLPICAPIPDDDDFMYERQIGGPNYKDITVVKWSRKTGDRIWKKTMPFYAYQFSNGYYLTSIQKVGNEYWVYIRRNNSKTKECYLTAQRLNQNMEFVGEEKIIASIKETPGKKSNLLSGVIFNVERQRDLFIVSGAYYSIKEPKVIRDFHCFTVLDTSMNRVWEKKIDLPIDKGYRVKEVSIVNNSKLIILYQTSTQKEVLKEKREDKTNKFIKTDENGFYVVEYNYRTDMIREKGISMPSDFNYFGREFCKIDTTSNSIDIFVEYNKLVDINGSQGVCHIGFDLEKMETANTALTPFSKEMLVNMLPEKKKDKEGLCPKTYFISNVYKTENEKFIYVLSEFNDDTYFYDKTSTLTPPTVSGNTQMAYTTTTTRTVTKIVHNFNNVIVLQTDTKGNIDWYNKIKKESKASFDNYIEIGSTYINGIVYLFFNATLKSANQPENGYEFKVSIFDSPSCLVLLGLNQNGVFKVKEQFSHGEENNYDCNISTIKQISPNKFKLEFDKSENRSNAILSIE